MILSWKLQLDYDLLVLSPHSVRRVSERERERDRQTDRQTGHLVMDEPNTVPLQKGQIATFDTDVAQELASYQSCGFLRAVQRYRSHCSSFSSFFSPMLRCR